MKNILIFISGFVAGVVYCLYRDVLSKPVEPVVMEVDNNGYVIDCDKSVPAVPKSIEKILLKISSADDEDTPPICIDDPLEEVNAWEMASAADYINFEKSLDKTQPVYIGEPEEVGVWELEEWAKESE